LEEQKSARELQECGKHESEVLGNRTIERKLTGLMWGNRKQNAEDTGQKKVQKWPLAQELQESVI
jgi:hypothetical protein